MTDADPSPHGMRRIAYTLLVALVVAALWAMVASFGWIRSARAAIDLDRLSSVERQTLFDEMSQALPGVYEPAWFQSEIGYTLRPDSTISAWGDTFVSNRLGYRTGRVRKEKGTFRILVVGDSWAYGMGVSREQSYPERLAELVTRHAGIGQDVEAWTLALPGYNALSQTAAFHFWFGSLRPNLVVFAPSSNDNDSNLTLLPSGEFVQGMAPPPDAFGSHPITYRAPHLISSFDATRRWRDVATRLRAAEQKLEYYRIPSVFFYVARWNPSFVHWLAETGSLSSPYAVVPAELTLGDWSNPGPWGHGTPQAQHRYAQLLYRLLATRLGWPDLPDEILLPEIAEVPVFEEVPDSALWGPVHERELAAANQRWIAASFVPGPDAQPQWAGPGAFQTGLVGKATTVLVRPPAGTPSLRVVLRPVEGIRAHYPIDVGLSVLADSPSQTAVTLMADAASEVEAWLPIPHELRNGEVLDVVLTASSVAALPGSRVAAAFEIARIEPSSRE